LHLHHDVSVVPDIQSVMSQRGLVHVVVAFCVTVCPV